ncbi:hypothetical protein RHCRD62_50162 [Rhodococcus sp. RD6.2]|nr:hypothetical protein RHCRD62_50162 [Rhodococcus sp. RD6.2]
MSLVRPGEGGESGVIDPRFDAVGIADGTRTVTPDR